jgi:hypothetical protein
MKRGRAIVLEQDPELRDLALVVLDEFGFEVTELKSTSAVESCVERYGSGVRLIVVGTPGGADLACSAAERWPWIKVLLTSPVRHPEDSLPHGVAYVPKPWGLNAVLETQKVGGIY